MLFNQFLLPLKKLPWAPFVATILVLNKCYIPGGQCDINHWYGIALWVLYLIFVVALQPLMTHRFSFSRQTAWPVLILLCISLVTTTSIPTAVGFRIYRADFEEFLKTHNRPWRYSYSMHGPAATVSVGPYPVYEFEVFPYNSVYCVTAVVPEVSHLAMHGFAYSPDNRHSLPPDCKITSHIAGGWYTFEKFYPYYNDGDRRWPL